MHRGADAPTGVDASTSTGTDDKDGASPSEDSGAAGHEAGRGDDAGRFDRSLDGGAPSKDAGDAGSPSHEDSGGGDGAEDAGTTDGGTVVPPCEPGGLPNVQTFKVPLGGGRFYFCTMHGTIARFDFPAGTAGLEVSASSVDPQTHVWVNAGFAEAIEEAIDLQPPTTFSDPIAVRFPDGAPLAFVFSATSGVPIPLERSKDEPSLLLLDRFGLDPRENFGAASRSRARGCRTPP